MENINKDSKYTKRTQDLVDYFKGEVTIKRDNMAKYSRAAALKKCIEIVESNDSDYEKAYQISLIYSNPGKLDSTTRELEKYKDDEYLGSFVEKIEKLNSFYADIYNSGKVNDIRYLMAIKDYLLSYKYSEFLISSYIESDNSYFISKFLNRYGIDKDTFEFCLDAVREVDPILYKKYEEKAIENKEIRTACVKDSLDNIIEGIKTGYLKDGSKFDLSEFFRLFPFRDNASVSELTSDIGLVNKLILFPSARRYLENTYPEYVAPIFKYISANRLNITRDLNTYDAYLPIRISEIYKTKHIVNGKEVTDSDKDNVLAYMMEKEMPMVSRAYSATLDKYLRGELTIDKEKQKTLSRSIGQTLVP